MPRPPFDHFGPLAPWYERIFGAYEVPQGVHDALALPTPGWLLDVGGGTGRVSRTLRAQVGGVVVADPSAGMAAQAQAKGEVRALRALAERLPFADDSIPRIIVVDAFHHFHAHTAAAAELWRVVAPGGRLVIVEPNIARGFVKLIALGERLLLMRSRFFDAAGLVGLFAPLPNAKVAADTDSDPFHIILVAEKTGPAAS